MMDSSPFLGVPQSPLTVWSDTVLLSSTCGVVHMVSYILKLSLRIARRAPRKGIKGIFKVWPCKKVGLFQEQFPVP